MLCDLWIICLISLPVFYGETVCVYVYRWVHFAHTLYKYFNYELICSHLNGLYKNLFIVCIILIQPLRSRISLSKSSKILEKRPPLQCYIGEGISEEYPYTIWSFMNLWFHCFWNVKKKIFFTEHMLSNQVPLDNVILLSKS